MIELPTFAVAALGFFAILGLVSILDWFTPVRGRSRVIMDFGEVNNSRIILMGALTNQAHRDGDPEF